MFLILFLIMTIENIIFDIFNIISNYKIENFYKFY